MVLFNLIGKENHQNETGGNYVAMCHIQINVTYLVLHVKSISLYIVFIKEENKYIFLTHFHYTVTFRQGRMVPYF